MEKMAWFESFLVTHAKNNALIPRAMELLRPFFLIADDAKYPLCGAEELDRDEAAHAIAHLVGRRVARIVTVSASKPIPRPEWMSTRARTMTAYSDFVEAAMHVSMGQSGSRRRLSTAIFRPFDPKTKLNGCLYQNLEEHLLPRLREMQHRRDRAEWPCMADGLPASFPLKIRQIVGEDIMRFCFLVAGCAAEGDSEMLDRITPFARLLPRAIPLCEKEDDPDAWLTLVA
jgi:hypothetical protein